MSLLNNIVQHRFNLTQLAFSLALVVLSYRVSANEDIFSLSLAELMQVRVITASKVSERLLLAPATIYVINEDDIRNNGYFTLVDALENIPGVTPINLGHFAFGGQRGFLGNFSKTLILINGREVQNLIAAETFINHQFSTYNIKQIEVINGPGSALYGANAFVGVINIITKIEDRSYEGIKLIADVGTNSTNSVSFVGAYSHNKLRIAASARFYQTDNENYSEFITDTKNFSEGFPTITHETIAANPAYDNRAWSIPASFRIDYGNIYAGSEYYRLVGRKGLENVALSFDSIQDEERNFLLNYLGWESTLTNGYHIKAEYQNYRERFWGSNAFFNEERFADLVAGGRDPNTPISTQEIHDQFLEFYSQEDSSGSKRNRIDISIHKEFGGDWGTTIGFSYDDLDILGVALSVADPIPSFNERVSNDNPMRKPYFHTRKRSLYLQLKKAFFDQHFNTTLGVRTDNHSLYGTVHTLRGGFSYELNPRTYVKTLYGQAFREPNIFEQGAFTQEFVDLQPEKIETYEVAINHQPSDNININISTYINFARDLIEANNTSLFSNQGKKRTSGLETLIKYENGQWSGDLAHTYNHQADKTIAGTKTDSLNNYTNRVSFTLHRELTNKVLLNARLNYFDQVDAEHGNPSIDRIIKIPSAIRLDFSARVKSFEVGENSMEFLFAIKNVLNKEYFQANVRNGGPKQFIQPGREISLQSTLRM